MAEAREVRVKLVVDTSEYEDAIKRAKTVTQELLNMGVDDKDIPEALKAVTKLAIAAGLSDARAANLAATAYKVFSLTATDALTDDDKPE